MDVEEKAENLAGDYDGENPRKYYQLALCYSYFAIECYQLM